MFVSDICGRCVGLGYWDTGSVDRSLTVGVADRSLAGVWGGQEVVPGVVKLLGTRGMSRSHRGNNWFCVKIRWLFCPARQLWKVDC